MSKQLIKLGHSPDPDDAFMFYGLACGAVDSGDYKFEHILRDIQTLNDWAALGKLEVTAVSVHAYAHLYEKYAILSSGASMGATELVEYIPDTPPADPNFASSKPTNTHGPLVVANQPMSLEQLKGKVVAIPGAMTSAFLALQLALGEFEYLVMMFDEIPDAVKKGKVDAGLIIHEGQLTYKKAGLHCLLDLGQWWHEKTSLPLPLGCNIIRRDLGGQAMSQISTILKASITYGLTHRREAVEYALQFGRGLNNDLADKFVGMYVNQWTVDYGPLGRKAIKEFLRQGHKANLIGPVENLQFV